MARRLISTNAFSSVAAGAQATLDLPVGGLVYHAVQLEYSGADQTQATLESDISEVRIKVNGKEQRRFTARELIDLNAFYGIPFVASSGILHIPFAEPWRRSVPGEDSLAWGTADIDSLQLEVDVAAGATTPSLVARSFVEKVARPMGPIVKWRRFNVSVAATGLRTVTTLPRNDAYMAVHCDSADIADVEVKLDQEEVFKADKGRADALYQQAAGQAKLVPQSDWFHIDFALNRVAEALAMVRGSGRQQRPVQELRFDFNMSSAASFDLLTLVLGPRD